MASNNLPYKLNTVSVKLSLEKNTFWCGYGDFFNFESSAFATWPIHLLFSAFSRLWSDSCKYPIYQPDLHLQVWCCAVHSAPGSAETATSSSSVCATSSWVENLCSAAHGIWQPEQGALALGELQQARGCHRHNLKCGRTLLGERKNTFSTAVWLGFDRKLSEEL